MFKLIVTDKGYSLYSYNHMTGKYNGLVLNSSINAIKKYNEVFLNKAIIPSEIDVAITDISESKYNGVEFGAKGYYTIPIMEKE